MKESLQALLSEFSYPLKCSVSVTPLVQAWLNHFKLRRLGDRARASVFMGLSAQSPLTVNCTSASANEELAGAEDLVQRQNRTIDELLCALNAMHKDIAGKWGKAQMQRRQSYNRRQQLQTANLDVGDVVLQGVVRIDGRNKMIVKCTGAHRISHVLSDHLYESEELLTGTSDIAQAPCIKIF